MLGPIRKFSTSIYAKILLGIIIIPFVFWGMGSNFKGGNRNVIVVIDKEKYSVRSFINYINKISKTNQKITKEQLESYLAAFIGDKLIEKEVNYFGIKLSDESLSLLLKEQKDFKRKGEFSRVEYEKFLLNNNITAAQFEKSFSAFQKKKMLLYFIGGGIYPTKYLVNKNYDEINQKRSIQVIDLNDIFKNSKIFSEDEIKSYYQINKKKYEEIYKLLKITELSPNNLIGNGEFTDAFFKKIDEIDYMIIEGKKFEEIVKNLNLENIKTLYINEKGKDKNSEINNNISENLIKNIFTSLNIDETALIEDDNKYFIIKVLKSEKVQKAIDDKNVKENIQLNLIKENKRKYISNLISKINSGLFAKLDFDKLSKDENIAVKKVLINNQNDTENLDKDVINHVYSFPAKNVIAINDISFSQSLLIYIDEIENAKIEKSSNEYKKYLQLAKNKIENKILDTYDNYIKKKYKIDINYQALDIVKNSFN